MTHSLRLRLLLATMLLSFGAWAQQPAVITDTTAPRKDSTLQKIAFGVKVGVNLQSVTGNTWDHDFKSGLVAGITMGMHKKKIGVRVEVLFHTSSFTSPYIYDSATHQKDVLNTLSVDIPVLFEYSVIPMLKLRVGPQYTNLMSVKSQKGLPGDPKVYFKSAEFSVVADAEAMFGKHFFAGARYILGLSNINNEVISAASSDQWKIQCIQVYLGYKFQ